jgi:hypothetical protein
MVRILRSPAPMRPIVLFQSDDWGRVGLPSLEALETIQGHGSAIGDSPWDYFGLETQGDVLALGETLAAFRDRDGTPPCFVTNFILANADLRRMRSEGFQTLRWVSLKDGFPKPWDEQLVPAYRRNIANKVFFPGLHGFTHFNPGQFLASLSEVSPRGDLCRKLVSQDIPYLASLTPEYNFALVNRVRGETFVTKANQWEWISKGAALFVDTFDVAPLTACAPGYRANGTTLRLWRKRGLKIAQTVGPGAMAREHGLLILQRNVFFEPVLSAPDVVARALDQAMHAVALGFPVVICTHSINYQSRFVGQAEESRLLLRTLIEELLKKFPGLRFATDTDLLDAYRGHRPGWLRRPNRAEIRLRASGIRHAH